MKASRSSSHQKPSFKGTRPKTALQIALESGQHSLAFLLLNYGYRLDLEQYAPLDMALQARRWDLFDLLLEWGADLKSADVYTVLNTYNVDLYERFRATGYNLTERHEMGAILGHGWIVTGPHIMILPTDVAQLDAYPTDWTKGGPWVMWKGTPYAHIMVPMTSMANPRQRRRPGRRPPTRSRPIAETVPPQEDVHDDVYR